MMRSLVLCLAGLAVFGCARPDEPEKEVTPTFLVQAVSPEVKTIRETVTLDGVFSAAQGTTAKLAPAAAGKLISVLAKEGDHVVAGQLLAQIDLRVLAAQSRSADSAAASARAQTRGSTAQLRAMEADHLATVRTAKLGVETAVAERDANVAEAKNELKRVKAGARPEEIEQAQQALKQAKVNRDQALETSKRDHKLFKEGFVSGQQADASEAAYQVSESAVKQAKAQVDLLEAGARKEEVRAAELRVDSAKTLGDKKVQLAEAALDQAKKGELAIDAKVNDVTATHLSADQKAEDATAAYQMAANGEIRAPFDGVISRRLLNKGDSADPTTPVFEITRAATSTDFVAQVAPRIGSMINVGLAASDADGHSGMVVSVGIADAQSGLIPVRIAFQSGAISGTSSRVSVVLRTLKDVMTLPESAIVTRDEKTVVFLVDGEKAKMQTVKSGPTETGATAILDGLKSTDKVVLVGQHELSDGAKIDLEKKAEDKR